jgi:hypothetical protein
MILPFEHDAQFKAAGPTFGSECASVLFQRGMIAENDKAQVAATIGQSTGSAALAAAELSQQHLITQQNKAVVAEFMNRVAKRMQLKAKGLTGCEPGSRRARAYRILKSTSLLTADRLTTLVTRLVVSAETPTA